MQKRIAGKITLTSVYLHTILQGKNPLSIPPFELMFDVTVDINKRVKILNLMKNNIIKAQSRK